VEKLMLAQELGRIKLSLRRSDDESEDAATGATLADLDAGSAGENRSLSIASKFGGGSGGITDFLNGMKALSNATADTSKQAWVMHIHTPMDVQVFNWDDRQELPRELLGTPAGGTEQFVPPSVVNPAGPASDETSLEQSSTDDSAEAGLLDTDSSATVLD
jgi:hypothetical protein